MKAWIKLGVATLGALASGGGLALGVQGCSNPGPLSMGGVSSGPGAGECIDGDGDNYGTGCVLGQDCDDGNASVTNECYRCGAGPTAGCSCPREGARARCGTAKSAVAGRVTCGLGEITCAGGTWSECRLNNATVAPLAVSGSSPCGGSCDPYCRELTDPPDAGFGLDGGGGSVWEAGDGGIRSEVQGHLTDAGQMPDASYFYHELIPGAPPVTDPFSINADITYIDVYFLLDTSATMSSALVAMGNAVAGPGGIIQSVRALFPNARFGVGHFHAYQAPPHDTTAGPFSAIPWIAPTRKAVFPLWHSLNMQTNDLAAQSVMLWLGAAGTSGNSDATEGANVALYTAATQGGLWATDGAGVGWATSYSGAQYYGGSGGGYWVNPRNAGGAQRWVTDYPGVPGGQPALPGGTAVSGACPAGTTGYACFDSKSLPITIVMSDNPGTQGPSGLFAISHGSTEATYTPNTGLPGSQVWPTATAAGLNGTEASARPVNPFTFQRYTGNLATNGSPVAGLHQSGGEAGFDLTNAANFPTVIPGDTQLGGAHTKACSGTEGAGGREAYFTFSIPAGTPRFVHFDTVGSEQDLVLYVIDRATRKRVACNNDIIDYTDPDLGARKQASIDARLAPGSYALVVDEKTRPLCPANYTAGSNGRCYRRITTSQTWATGRAACVADGANLAVTLTPSPLGEDPIMTAVTSDGNGWIGLSRATTTSPWTWADGSGYVAGTALWAVGQPAATGVNVHRRTPSEWVAVTAATTRPTYCEKAPVAQPTRFFLQVNAMDDTAPVALPSFEQMVAAHNAIGGKIIGVDVSGIGKVNATGTDFDTCDTFPSSKFNPIDRWGYVSLQEAARRTGSIDGTNPNYWTNPFVFAMNANGGPCKLTDPPIGGQVVSAITRLTDTLRQDVSIRAKDSDNATDFDYPGPALASPAQLTPLDLDEGPNPGIGRPYGVFIQTVTVLPLLTGNGSHAPGPGGQPRCLDSPATTDVIEGCLPNTTVRFNVGFSVPVSVPQRPTAQIFKFDVEVVGSGAGALASKPAVIVVPPTGAFTPGSFVREYDTTTICGVGTHPVWGHWSWATTCPSDSQVQFFVATAPTLAGLATALEDPIQFTSPPGPGPLVGTAVGAHGPALPGGDTQTGAAAVDTTLALNSRKRNEAFLRIRGFLQPDSTMTLAPTLTSWNLAVSCIPEE